MPASPQFQTRLPPDRAELVAEYAEEHNISQAEAVRRLIYAGLGEIVEDDDQDAEDVEDEPDRGHGWWGAAAATARESARTSIQYAGFTATITAGLILLDLLGPLAGFTPSPITDWLILAGAILAPLAVLSGALLYVVALATYARQGADWRAELPGRVPL